MEQLKAPKSKFSSEQGENCFDFFLLSHGNHQVMLHRFCCILSVTSKFKRRHHIIEQHVVCMGVQLQISRKKQLSTT
jgi:hypothetical protein